MKAARINKYGGSDVIEINDNESKPTPGENQVLVEVFAASLNPFDWKVREGYLKDAIPLKFPFTLGGDFAGVIKDSGEEVFGSANVVGGGSGSLAEFAAANNGAIAKKPKSLNFVEAAASVLVGVSALQALEEHINLQKGQKILIHGGAGGIGSTTIQLAKSIGAYVATTVSSDDIEFVKGLGADEVIDYKTQDFSKNPPAGGFDAVFDMVGGETTNKSFLVLKQGGVLVSMLGQPNEELSRKYGVTAIGQNTKTDTKHLDRLRELIDSGKIKVKVDKVFPLDATKEAFDFLEHASPRGKVVVKIKEN